MFLKERIEQTAFYFDVISFRIGFGPEFGDDFPVNRHLAGIDQFFAVPS